MHVRPMEKADIKRLEKWKYKGDYAYYDVDGIGEELLAADAQLLCFGPFIVAYYCFGKEARIPVGEKLLAYTETDCTDIALSMRPVLCGHGWGGRVLERGMAFARETMGASRFRLTVAAANLRALTIYQRAGFAIVRSFSLNGKDGPRQFYVMVRQPREEDLAPKGKKVKKNG